MLLSGCCCGDTSWQQQNASAQDPAELMGFPVQVPLLSAMAQQSPQTGLRGTPFKNRPEVKAAKGGQKQDGEEGALDYLGELI